MWPGRARSAGCVSGRDGGQDGSGAVGGGDAGGDAFAGIDRFAEGGAEIRRVVRRHQRQAKSVAALAGKREADQAAAVRGHEVDDFGRDFFSGDSEIAFVFAIFVVDDDEHAPGAGFFDGFGNGCEGHQARTRSRMATASSISFSVTM